MHRYILPWSLAILLCMYRPAYSQVVVSPNRTHFSWKKIERKPSKTELDQFIRQTPNSFENFRQKPSKYSRLTLDSLHRRLHFLDINGDDRLDVIFDGESGGEANHIEIFLNLGNSYKKVFADIQSIYTMEWREGRLYKLYIFDWGCCDDYLNFSRDYQVAYDKAANPDFVKMDQKTFVRRTEFPDTTLKRSIRFEVMNDNYNLRYAPIVDDVSRQIWEDDATHQGHGNVIGKLSKGAQGTALAKKTDPSGREWYFVEIDEEFYPAGNVLLSENKNDFPTKTIGWVSSRFVRIL